MPTQKSPRTPARPQSGSKQPSKLPSHLKGAAIVRSTPPKLSIPHKQVPLHLQHLSIGPHDLQYGALRFLYNRLFHEVDMLSPSERLVLVREIVRHSSDTEIELMAEVIGERMPSKLSTSLQRQVPKRKGR